MKQNSKLVSAGALEMYALGCIDKEDLEWILQKRFSELTAEELQYIRDVADDYERYAAMMRKKYESRFIRNIPDDSEIPNITINIYNQYFK